MEGSELLICKICNNPMVDPRILPCYHSFCLKCLESAADAAGPTLCPACQVEFQLPEGGWKDLKTNKFVENLKVLHQARVNCDSCRENRAAKFCVECSYSYCSSCLEHHKRIPTCSNHKLMDSTVEQMKPPKCEYHSSSKDLFCMDCSALLCCCCWTQKHSTHKVLLASEYFAFTVEKFNLSLSARGKKLCDIIQYKKILKQTMVDNELKALHTKKRLKIRGDFLKRDISLYFAELNEFVNKELKQCQKEAHLGLEGLSLMEGTLRKQMNELNQQLNELNLSSIDKISFLEDFKEEIPTHHVNMNFSFQFNLRDDLSMVRKLVGTLTRGSRNKGLTMRTCGSIIAQHCSRLFARNQGDVFASCVAGGNMDLMSLSRMAKFANKSLIIAHDFMTFNNALYLLGCSADSTKIYRMDYRSGSKPVEFYKLPDDASCWGLSVSYERDILVVLSKKIIHLCENGNVAKAVNLSFGIRNAVQLCKHRYVCCYGEGLCTIDSRGSIIAKYEPPPQCNLLTSSYGLAADKYAHIYIGEGNFITVLDFSLKHVLRTDAKAQVLKIYYDERTNRLSVLTARDAQSSKILLYDLIY